MTFEKVRGWLGAAVVCSLLAAAGCAGPGKKGGPITTGPEKPIAKPATDEPVTLALKFAADDSATYRLIMEDTKSVEFEGKTAKDGTLQGGQTGTKIQMEFTQHIQSVAGRGNAIAQVTIRKLTYLAQEKDAIRIDFDSSREKDRRSPLAKLIGQSYTIEITPAGKVTKVVDAGEARAAVRGGTEAHLRAAALLKAGVIKDRHSIAALPAADRNQLRTGEDWSNLKTINFGMMGKKSYERIYLLKEVAKADRGLIALVEMSAIPTVEGQPQADDAASGFAKMFDNVQTYTGQLKLDLTTGKLVKYLEQLRSEWFAVDFTAPETEKDPDSLTMTAVRLHSLERID